MKFVDTHTHLYLPEFEKDRKEVVQKAVNNGVVKMLLPNVDSSTIEPLLSLANEFPDHCLPMMGLHPTSVKENYEEELDRVKSSLTFENIVAVGETGIDLYWDKTHLDKQIIAFKTQLQWASQLNLPIVIHVRNSFDEVFNVIENVSLTNLRGVFHCFSGNLEQAEQAVNLGFMLGIGGVVTFKNSGLDKVLENICLSKILLETDSPYLAPVPFRGKRNESAYINIVAKKIAEIKNVNVESVASITSENAEKLFNLGRFDRNKQN
ncbi:MAG: TatD family hydrolase [Bacteroidales bacterium]|nr:TatD family hydrolase [Bacteroidales bacterium]